MQFVSEAHFYVRKYSGNKDSNNIKRIFLRFIIAKILIGTLMMCRCVHRSQRLKVLPSNCLAVKASVCELHVCPLLSENEQSFLIVCPFVCLQPVEKRIVTKVSDSVALAQICHLPEQISPWLNFSSLLLSSNLILSNSRQNFFFFFFFRLFRETNHLFILSAFSCSKR